MWWIETTGYHLAGLIWLIVIAVIFVIAVVALSTAGAAMSSASKSRRMLREHEAYHLSAGPGTSQTSATGARTDSPGQWGEMGFAQRGEMAPPSARTPPSALIPEEQGPAVVESEQRPTDGGLGDSMRILHERYARGEITRDEYLRAREDMMAMTR